MAILLDFPHDGDTLSFQTDIQRDYVAGEKERAEMHGADIDYLNLEVNSEDHSFPEAHFCRFSAPGTQTAVLFAPEGYAPVLVETNSDMVRVPYLPAGARVRWQVFSVNDEGKEEISRNGYFYTDGALPRFIRVPGASNVRDCGGWKTMNGQRIRQGMIFRGSEWDSHYSLTTEGERVLAEEMHLRTELDLRGESREGVPGVLEENGVHRVRIPVEPYDRIFTPEVMEAYGACFQLFSEPELYPFYLHCWGGADRTGTLAYLLQTFLGVPRQTAILDYEMTTMSVHGVRYRQFHMFANMERNFLQWYGDDGEEDMQKSVYRYLLDCGVRERELALVRAILLEDAPSHCN